jgi:hypothetical protein
MAKKKAPAKLNAAKVIVAKNTKGLISIWPGDANVEARVSKTGTDFVCLDRPAIAAAVPAKAAEVYFGKVAVDLEMGKLTEAKWTCPLAGSK